MGWIVLDNSFKFGIISLFSNYSMVFYSLTILHIITKVVMFQKKRFTISSHSLRDGHVPFVILPNVQRRTGNGLLYSFTVQSSGVHPMAFSFLLLLPLCFCDVRIRSSLLASAKAS